MCPWRQHVANSRVYKNKLCEQTAWRSSNLGTFWYMNSEFDMLGRAFWRLSSQPISRPGVSGPRRATGEKCESAPDWPTLIESIILCSLGAARSRPGQHVRFAVDSLIACAGRPLLHLTSSLLMPCAKDVVSSSFSSAYRSHLQKQESRFNL